MLVLVSTPIGNLADFSPRAIETLQSCSRILCEDTRVSRILFSRYEIQKPLLSFHRFNERKREGDIIRWLKEGETIGLVADAGTPAICDPGARLVDRCLSERIDVSAIPGPCALTTAMSLSGYVGERFQFLGYLPKKRGSCLRLLQEILDYPGASVGYETPHQLLKTLSFLEEIDPQTPLFLMKEATKRYEKGFRGRAKELSPLLSQVPIKGEWVMVFFPKKYLFYGEKQEQPAAF